MAIDLLNLEPSVISKDLKGKYVCIYSLPKVGKTTMACSFPKNLLLGFEHGWNALSGVMALDITKWSDYKLALRQLENKDVRAKYDTITIDTVGIAWEMCEQYICAQHGVTKIGDIPWGGGYAAQKKEFESCLRKITQLGYGLVIIAHVDKRIEKRADDSEVEILGPAIPRRCYDIVNQLVDIIGYIDVNWDEEGNSVRKLYTRKTPTVMAGTRFRYLESVIDFGYDELVEAISAAIDKEQQMGANVVEHAPELQKEKELSFLEVREKASKLWSELVQAKETEEEKTEMANAIMRITEDIFGTPVKLSEITEKQVDLFSLVVYEMEELKAKQK